MEREIRIGLAGAGGWGEWYYLKGFLFDGMACRFKLVGIVEPYPERCNYFSNLCDAKIPIYRDMETFYSATSCDLMILSTPIQYHCQQVCLALKHGSHVLCEKPLCASLEQIDLMKAAEKASGKTVSIGYQWSFSKAIRALKADIFQGKYGAPLRLRAITCWPRGEGYFHRNSWAGKITTDAGEPVLDSPVNNATAHFLHNMLFVLSSSAVEAHAPVSVEADLWRANPIENYDTAALRIVLANEAELYFYTSHTTVSPVESRFCYEFERGVVTYDSANDRVVGTLSGGEVIDYGSPEDEPYQKILDAVHSSRTGAAPVCGISDAAVHTQCVIMAQESTPGIQDFASSKIQLVPMQNSCQWRVEGLDALLQDCYASGRLFSAQERAQFRGMQHPRLFAAPSKA